QDRHQLLGRRVTARAWIKRETLGSPLAVRSLCVSSCRSGVPERVGWASLGTRGDDTHRTIREVADDMGSQSEDDTMGDEVYQPEGLDDREDEGILDAEDTLEDRGADPYDE